MKQAEIQSLLPVIFQRTITPGSPLLAILQVMEALHGPAEAVLADLDCYFDPRRTPDAFVPYLARWVDLERLFDRSALAGQMNGNAESGVRESAILSTGLGPLRELIAIAAYLSRWRGTARGLVLFLETALDTPGFEVSDEVFDAAGKLRPFHLQVCAPAATEPHRALIERIVETEKPAYVTYELVFAA